jgi:hypothetical protein
MGTTTRSIYWNNNVDDNIVSKDYFIRSGVGSNPTPLLAPISGNFR